MLLAMIWSAGWAQKVTLDFSKSSNPWKLPTTSYSKVEKSYSYNGYTISFKNGTDLKGYMFTGQWKFSGDKHKSLQVDTERTFHQRYPLVML